MDGYSTDPERIALMLMLVLMEEDR